MSQWHGNCFDVMAPTTWSHRAYKVTPWWQNNYEDISVQQNSQKTTVNSTCTQASGLILIKSHPMGCNYREMYEYNLSL